MNHMPGGPGRVGAVDDEQREFVLIDDDADRPQRIIPKRDMIAAVLGSVAVRVEPLTSTVADGEDRGAGVELLVTATNVEDQTRYLPPLEAAGYVLRFRVSGIGC